jgi:hypothetical protein
MSTITKRPRHFLLHHAGVEVFRVYRHGDTRDAFQSCWFRTADAPRQEFHATDFDVRCLPADICERHGVPTTRTGMPELAAAAAAIREAIDRGIVTAKGGPA